MLKGSEKSVCSHGQSFQRLLKYVSQITLMLEYVFLTIQDVIYAHSARKITVGNIAF